MKPLISQIPRSAVAALAALASCSACSTTGTAVGRLEQPQGKGSDSGEEVSFVWKSDAAHPDRGTITGTLPDGHRYSGHYFEVLQTADADLYSPAWVGWRPYWPEWRMGWYSGPKRDLDWPGFVTIYTGKVIANLKSPDDAGRLRCRSRLDDPRAGLVHGGHGQCQLSNGQTIEHVIVASS